MTLDWFAGIVAEVSSRPVQSLAAWSVAPPTPVPIFDRLTTVGKLPPLNAVPLTRRSRVSAVHARNSSSGLVAETLSVKGPGLPVTATFALAPVSAGAAEPVSVTDAALPNTTK